MDHGTGTLPDWLTKEYPFAQNLHTLSSGVGMNFVDEGEGEPVLMLHGNPTWSYFYRNVIKALEQKEFRCIAPDHIGCGLSEKPQDYEYRLANHIDNLESLVNHLNLENVHLVVHDWGGAIGFGWAVRNVEKVKSITILNTAAFRSSSIPLRIAVCKLPLIGEYIVRKYNAFAGAAVTMAVQNKLPEDVKRGFLYPCDNFANRIATARFVEDIPMNTKHPSWETLQKIESKLPDLAHLRRSINIIWGMKDWCFSPMYMRRWQEIFSDAYLERYKNAGHYLLEDAGEEIIPHMEMMLEVARSD